MASLTIYLGQQPADPWDGIPFGSLPAAPAGQYWPSGGDKGGATFGSFKFVNRPAGVNVMVLENISNATFDLIDFDTVPEGIYMVGCNNVTISRLRATNIFGPFTRTGFHSGNLIQMTNCSNITVEDLKLAQPHAVPPGYGTDWGTEDIISIGGDPGTYGDITIRRFQFDGGAWQSWSGTGLFVGDGASGYNVTIEDGVLINPGQCAIGTGEEGPYTFQRIDAVTSVNGNAAFQLRSNDTSIRNVRVDWMSGAPYAFGGTPVVATSFVDLGGNDWYATLNPPAVTL